MPLLNSDYLDRSDMTNSEIETSMKTPETSFNGDYHQDVHSLDNYSVRDDDEEDTSSDEETQGTNQPENSSLKSWFFKPKSKSAATSPTKENAKEERINSSGSAITQSTPTNSKSGSPFRKSLRSFFRREEVKDSDVTQPENSTLESAKDEEPPRQHRFWKSWRGHHSHPNGDYSDSEHDTPQQETVENDFNASKVDPDDMLTHEQKRERNMERLTQQLMNFSSDDDEENGRKSHRYAAEKTHGAGFIEGNVVHDDDDDSNYESSDSSASSSVERAREVKAKIGQVFSPASEEILCKNNEISPITPVDDVMDNPYKYVFEPVKAQSNASIAHDCSWIDKNSVAFDNFDKALRILTDGLNCSSSLEGSLFTISELSNEFLDMVKNYTENHEKVAQEKIDMEITLNTVQSSFGNLRKEVEDKDRENVKLKTELELLKDKYSHLEKDFESLSEEAEILTDEVAHSKKDFFAAKDCERTVNERTQEQVNTLKKELEIKTKEFDETLADLQRERAKQDSSQANQETLQSKQDSLQNKLDCLEADNKTINCEFQSSKKEYDIMKAKYDFVESQYQTLRSECDAIRAKHESMQTNHHSMEEQYESLRAAHESLKLQFDTVQNDYKTTIFDNEIIHEKNNILTTRLSDLVGSMNKGGNDERDMKCSNQESFSNKLRRSENIIELLKVGNLKIQDNFRSERSKVLDLRKDNKTLRKQIQLTECYRIQSLQFMSHLMLYYRGIVTDETLASFEFHLKTISNFGSITEFMVEDDATEKKMKDHETMIVKFYNEIAKESFLDQIVTKHVSYMRSNNFLSNQLSGLKKQMSEYEEYANRLLQEIETHRKTNDKNQKKIAYLKGELSQCSR
ncbi:hypothetical protein ZYGR_0H00970 [Zygosaccharomyces rouxii]|uniref:ZYRO0B06182p n=2 Tax=Zygosaccharomyces rouxii TaxID=4956 RepID=C5DR77_ZYGRC|nr:uncharacterized protein ZYRO0B06182g [Zygosaccharomyces rouxii]KAH9200167.1 hypothetical protein LQ764DRAFT_113441 [Zygosaccharomyces rouxii]GAV47256.1 hypothetical protein ZYGR_0H00970 [Zygosaccharomyces rouxii]CAR26288.1 ZYRO0B06182p [Zygosaccharomyces rouxii]